MLEYLCVLPTNYSLTCSSVPTTQHKILVTALFTTVVMSHYSTGWLKNIKWWCWA